MRNKIILNLAMSIDGFIADENDGYDWIEKAAGDGRLNTKDVWSYDKFLEGVSAVVMGKRSYDLGMWKGFESKKVYVAAYEDLADHDNVSFIKGDIYEIAKNLKEKHEGDIYLFGGGLMIDKFLKAKVIDEYIIGIIPVILGKGIPLFHENNPFISLELTGYYIENGVVILRYVQKA